MPSQYPSIGSEYGFLDSTCVGDGRPLDAHVLRTIARNSNRLALRSQPLASLVWPASLPAVADVLEQHIFYAMPFWTQVTPRVPLVKKPYITDAKLFWMLGASDDADIGLQVATEQAPFDRTLPVETSKTVEVITGSATSPYGDVEGVKYTIPLREGPTESVTFYLRGGYGALGDTGTYGSPNSGTIESITPSGNRQTIVKVSGATWETHADAADWYRGGHAFVFKNGTDVLLEPRQIRWVPSADELVIFPTVPEDYRGDALRGADFEIRKLPIVRFHSLMLYGMDAS